MRRTISKGRNSNVELYRVGDYKALYVGRKNQSSLSLLCEICGVELRSGVYEVPDYQKSLLNRIDVIPADSVTLGHSKRNADTTETHPFRDLLINTQRNIENVINLIGGSSVEQEVGKQLVILLLANDPNLEKYFFMNVEDFEMGVVHTVKLYMEQLHPLFYPYRHNEDVIILFAKAKVLEAMQHHVTLRQSFPELRHAYRANEIRHCLLDVISQYLTGEHRQNVVKPVALNLLEDVIKENVAIERSSEVIACAIVCAACVLAKIPAPCKELLARNYNILTGVILGVQHEIETTLIKKTFEATQNGL